MLTEMKNMEKEKPKSNERNGFFIVVKLTVCLRTTDDQKLIVE